MESTTHRVRVRQTREESRARIVAATVTLLRQRSFAELTVDEVMREVGQGRTIFYRHFDDLSDLIVRASQEAIEALYDAQRALGRARDSGDSDVAIRLGLEHAVEVYAQHGPLLRGVAEAAAADEQIAEGHREMRRRYDDLIEQWLRSVAGGSATGHADLAQTARALNLMNENYLLDAFGREPRVSPDTAVQTLTEIWDAVIHR